jgi:hypothetical protein
MRLLVEQITKADRNACHALGRKGKARATLRQLSSTVLHTFLFIYDNREMDCISKFEKQA